MAGGWRRNDGLGLDPVGLDEMMARYASFGSWRDQLQIASKRQRKNIRKLFRRIFVSTFSAATRTITRDHAAFWNGRDLRLTPAYDTPPAATIGPRSYAGDAHIRRNSVKPNRRLYSKPPRPSCSRRTKRRACRPLVKLILDQWHEVCEEGALSPVERNRLWRRQILNPFAFVGAPDEISGLLA